MKVKTSFDFDAAHRLSEYESKCSNLHGHRWKVEIEVEGEKVNEDGIMWDFTNVGELARLFDHKTILKDCEENNDLARAIITTCGNDSLYTMKENPTAENLCKEILGHLKRLNPDLKFKVTIWESPISCCEAEK